MYKAKKEGLVARVNKENTNYTAECGGSAAAIQQSQTLIDQQNALQRLETRGVLEDLRRRTGGRWD